MKISKKKLNQIILEELRFVLQEGYSYLNSFEDAYEYLGVSPDASVKDIKRAYKRLAMKHHPDKNPNDPTASQKFHKAQEAFEAATARSEGQPPETRSWADGTPTSGQRVYQGSTSGQPWGNEGEWYQPRQRTKSEQQTMQWEREKSLAFLDEYERLKATGMHYSDAKPLAQAFVDKKYPGSGHVPATSRPDSPRYSPDPYTSFPSLTPAPPPPSSVASMMAPRTSVDGKKVSVVYDFNIEDTSYEVTFKQKSPDAPWDMSFNEKGKTEFETTNRGHAYRMKTPILTAFEDFAMRNPERLKYGFQFTGAEQTPGAGGMQATKRTRVFNRLMSRYLSASPVFKDAFHIGDMSWAGAPNTIRVKKIADPHWDLGTDYISQPLPDRPAASHVDAAGTKRRSRRGGFDTGMIVDPMSAAYEAGKTRVSTPHAVGTTALDALDYADVSHHPELQAAQDVAQVGGLAGLGYTAARSLAKGAPGGLYGMVASVAGDVAGEYVSPYLGSVISHIPGVGDPGGMSPEEAYQAYQHGRKILGLGAGAAYDYVAKEFPGSRQHQGKKDREGVARELDRLMALEQKPQTRLEGHNKNKLTKLKLQQLIKEELAAAFED